MIETLDLLRLFGGFVYLVMGGDLLVRGALGLSRRTAISPALIGLTVVAFGTSAPELVISLVATLGGFTGVALGNVVGSNIANVLLVLGAPALIRPVLSDARELPLQTLFMAGVSVLMTLLALNGVLSRSAGLLLLMTLLLALALAYRHGVRLPGADTPDDEEQLERVLGLPHSVPVAITFVVLGVVMLPVGANLTVEGAVAIARVFSLPEVVIGSTIVALGTSLPELSTSLIAAFHRSSDIALANVVGSNVFNILLVAGAAATVAPLPVPDSMLTLDFPVMLGAALLMLLFVARRWPVGRLAGATFVAAYVAYLAIVV